MLLQCESASFVWWGWFPKTFCFSSFPKHLVYEGTIYFFRASRCSHGSETRALGLVVPRSVVPGYAVARLRTLICHLIEARVEQKIIQRWSMARWELRNHKGTTAEENPPVSPFWWTQTRIVSRARRRWCAPLPQARSTTRHPRGRPGVRAGAMSDRMIVGIVALAWDYLGSIYGMIWYILWCMVYVMRHIVWHVYVYI